MPGCWQSAAAADLRGPLCAAIEPLASHRDAIVELSSWFEQEWPEWYGPAGRASARDDLCAYAAGGPGLPFGVVALLGDEVCGVAALRAESIASHRHLAPWATALLVKTSRRRRGIGSLLLEALEREAKARRFAEIHCATASAESLLLRRNWLLHERIALDGSALGVYRKAL